MCLNYNISSNKLSPRIGYIVIFKRLAVIPNVALLVRPMVPTPLRAPITTNLSIKKIDLRQFLHTICCDKRCNTNQLGKIDINVKFLDVLNYRYMYIF